MRDWIEEARLIAELDPAWRVKARTRLKEQTRPEGSLGILESLLERLVAIQQKERPEVSRKRILIFAADHGVSEENVSLYPREVTQAMVRNFLNGSATVNALARHIAAEVRVVDCGVDGDFSGESALVHAKVRRGTRNMTRECAMTQAELDQVLETGWDLAGRAKSEGVQLLGIGEMGIGNTTAASAVIAALLQCPVESVTGRGTGLGDAALAHKISVIQKAHALHQASMTNPLQILRCVGGYELAAMTGAILACARHKLPAVVDGWIVSASALAAVQMNPKILDYLFFAHQSEERGHRLLLDRLEIQPVFNLAMRLGEASGTALAMGVLEAAVRVYNEVATFEEASVSHRDK